MQALQLCTNHASEKRILGLISVNDHPKLLAPIRWYSLTAPSKFQVTPHSDYITNAQGALANVLILLLLFFDRINVCRLRECVDQASPGSGNHTQHKEYQSKAANHCTTIQRPGDLGLRDFYKRNSS